MSNSTYLLNTKTAAEQIYWNLLLEYFNHDGFSYFTWNYYTEKRSLKKQYWRQPIRKSKQHLILTTLQIQINIRHNIQNRDMSIRYFCIIQWREKAWDSVEIPLESRESTPNICIIKWPNDRWLKNLKKRCLRMGQKPFRKQKIERRQTTCT